MSTPYNNNELWYDYSGEFPTASIHPQLPPPPLVLPISGGGRNEHDLLALAATGGYTSSGCSSYSSSPRSFFETMPETSSFGKVLRSDDMQGVSMAQPNQRLNSSLANEINIMESMSRASPYSPEEKRERIERYRNKRNLRNFNKKIKYECRKTLADSRPRIRGRFVRNDEIEMTPQTQWDNNGVIEEEYDEDQHNWIHFLDPFSVNLLP